MASRLVHPLLQQLPAELHAALVAKGCNLAQAVHIERLSHGLSNQNYRIATREREFALRINSDASNTLCSRHSEVQLWRSAAQASIAPQLYYVSDDYRYYLSEFILNTVDWGQLMSINHCEPQPVNPVCQTAHQSLLSLLQGLKALPVPDNAISVAQQWHEYFDKLSLLSGQVEGSLGQRPAWLTRFELLKRHEPRVQQLLDTLAGCMVAPQFSHRDLNPYNLLLSGDRLWCIDYEYACSSHPLVDLASVLATHKLSGWQRQWLIAHYLQDHSKLNGAAFNAVPAAIELYWYFALCWALLMQGESLVNEVKVAFTADVKVPNLTADYLEYFDQFLQCIAAKGC
ncbi:phosphotransferase [Shewanella algidipiscicola]|uniref:phosphotransferase n=1 Tax=Shewanella algidipiscicola TaxID=614070 RepID=UPI001EF65612|nr:phosphotransferase [Shewanella algidipiscicola]